MTVKSRQRGVTKVTMNRETLVDNLIESARRLRWAKKEGGVKNAITGVLDMLEELEAFDENRDGWEEA